MYNETVSNNVYWITEHYVESVYADFKNGYIQTAYEMRNDPMNEFRNKTSETVSDNLKKEIDSAFEKLNALEPSEQAKDFHQAITDYLNAVKGPLADALLAYCTLDTLDEEQKNALTQKVNEAYDKSVHEFLSRRLDRTWFPYLFVDATYLDVRVGHRVVCRALVVATGVSAEGRREILGMALGDAETVDFWTSFLRSLRERGLKVPSPEDPTGVVLVTSDAHAGIRAAVRAILPGASWQRCRVHFARNITSRLGSARSKPVNALVSTIFAQTSREAVAAQYKHVVDSLREASTLVRLRDLRTVGPDVADFH